MDKSDEMFYKIINDIISSSIPIPYKIILGLTTAVGVSCLVYLSTKYKVSHNHITRMTP